MPAVCHADHPRLLLSAPGSKSAEALQIAKANQLVFPGERQALAAVLRKQIFNARRVRLLVAGKMDQIGDDTEGEDTVAAAGDLQHNGAIAGGSTLPGRRIAEAVDGVLIDCQILFSRRGKQTAGCDQGQHTQDGQKSLHG